MATRSDQRRQIAYRGLALPARARLTPQRRAVLDAIEASSGRFTAVELFQRARRSSPRLGLATTYRTLELLRRTGSLEEVDGGEATARGFDRVEDGAALGRQAGTSWKGKAAVGLMALGSVRHSPVDPI